MNTPFYLSKHQKISTMVFDFPVADGGAVGHWDCPYLGPKVQFTELPAVLETLPWENRTPARGELFYADSSQPVSYTYGKPPSGGTYLSKPMVMPVAKVINAVNELLSVLRPDWPALDVAFLNRYAHDRQALGWHADDSPEVDHAAPIAVVSFGQARELWTRPKDDPKNITKWLLESKSLFVMPPGHQQTHDHRIPKGGRAMGPRVSITLRRLATQEKTL